MKSSEDKKKKHIKKRKRDDLPVFDSDHDFLKAFEKNNEIDTDQKDFKENPESPKKTENPEKEDFAQLLEESFKKKGKHTICKKEGTYLFNKKTKTVSAC